MNDVVVIGAGVVGLSAAVAMARRGLRVVVIDKERAVGAHASGRNSGVLHAGFYYSADSLKASTCVEGSRRWRALCAAKGLALRRCGKLVVAQSEAELVVLDRLLERGRANGVRLELIDAEQARRIEPRVRTHRRALWSPDTATTDPQACMAALAAEAHEHGVTLRLGEAFVARTDDGILTTAGPLPASRVLAAAGLQADQVAAAWGAGAHLRVVPFRGLYLYGDRRAGPLSTCVYPVPEPDMPFLGVHFTVTPAGDVKIGPTAMPALWREHYGGLANLDLAELGEVAGQQTGLFLRDGAFRRLAWREAAKVSRRVLAGRARALLDGVEPAHFRRWGPPGIRAQLLDRRTGRLVDDFVVERADRSLHVLNAVSPAFTSSLALADRLADQVEAL